MILGQMQRHFRQNQKRNLIKGPALVLKTERQARPASASVRSGVAHHFQQAIGWTMQFKAPGGSLNQSPGLMGGRPRLGHAFYLQVLGAITLGDDD